MFRRSFDERVTSSFRDLRIDYLPQVLAAVCRAYHFGWSELDQLLTNSFEGSFAKTAEKREFVQKLS